MSTKHTKILSSFEWDIRSIDLSYRLLIKGFN